MFVLSVCGSRPSHRWRDSVLLIDYEPSSASRRHWLRNFVAEDLNHRPARAFALTSRGLREIDRRRSIF
jgi:hypothetical protein